MLSEKNSLMEKANQAMEDFYVFEKEREMYLAACRYESGRVSMINESERKGIAKGIQQGIEQGINRGAYQKAIETAAAFKRLGIDIDKIAEGTGLSREEIAKL